MRATFARIEPVRREPPAQVEGPKDGPVAATVGKYPDARPLSGQQVRT